MVVFINLLRAYHKYFPLFYLYILYKLSEMVFVIIVVNHIFHMSVVVLPRRLDWLLASRHYDFGMFVNNDVIQSAGKQSANQTRPKKQHFVLCQHSFFTKCHVLFYSIVIFVFLNRGGCWVTCLPPCASVGTRCI